MGAAHNGKARFNIYVIELSKDILKVRKFREANPKTELIPK